MCDDSMCVMYVSESCLCVSHVCVSHVCVSHVCVSYVTHLKGARNSCLCEASLCDSCYDYV